MSAAPPQWLTEHLPPRGTSTQPWITVTWAQSLDSKIAGPGGSRVILSGPESMEMTHWMRTIHDGILVGINTIIMDNPRLGIPLVQHHDPGLLPPQPIILDPSLRFPLTARILSEWNTNKEKLGNTVRQPWLICGQGVSRKRMDEVESAGARVIPVELTDGRISPNTLVELLPSLGLGSVMIEGGSRILSSFLRSPPRPDGKPVVDSIILTVAPMFIGDGISFVPQEDMISLPQLDTIFTTSMGKDAVIVCKIEQ